MPARRLRTARVSEVGVREIAEVADREGLASYQRRAGYYWPSRSRGWRE
jgi:hypothetical protein